MKLKKAASNRLPSIKADQSYLPGENPERDAWYTAFFIENHLDYYSHPDHAATPEQVRKMSAIIRVRIACLNRLSTATNLGFYRSIMARFWQKCWRS
jgi:hypothetical protein